MEKIDIVIIGAGIAGIASAYYLQKNFPNFLKKDLEKFINIILNEIKNTLKRGERVELRGFGIFSTNIHR